MISATTAARFFHGVREQCEVLQKKEQCSLVLIWNGNSIPAKALTSFARQHHIDTLYFELANIPGKLFVDPWGVNAQSLLYAKPQILDTVVVTEEQYFQWRNRYLQYKRSERITPLAAQSRKIHNPLFLIDALAVSLFNLPSIGEMNIIRKIRQLLQKPASKFLFDDYPINDSTYNFFPMQLSNDSQLVINSAVPQEDALIRAVEISREQEVDLLVKPHPLEQKGEVFQFLSLLKKTKGVYVVTIPTFQLVERCREIITINSTVGLEGLIAQKKVSFLGNSFYSFFNEERLRNYLLGYLIDIDYFAADDLSIAQLDTVLSRRAIV
ncbi:MAG: hypothetical protein AB1600_11985 [Bacteroidota bacterium]